MHVGAQFGHVVNRHIKVFSEQDDDRREYRTVDIGENTVDQEKEENTVFFDSRPIEGVTWRI